MAILVTPLGAFQDQFTTLFGGLLPYCLLSSLQLIKEVKDAPVQNKARPQHRGQHPLLFSNSEWVL